MNATNDATGGRAMRLIFAVLTGMCLLIQASAALAQDPPPKPIPRPERFSAESATESGEAASAEGEGEIAGPPARLNDLDNAFQVFDTLAAQPVVNLALGDPQPVTLSAKVTEDGPIIPAGLTWRIFRTTPDENGELPMLAKSSDAAAAFSLQPGEYVAHVAYGRAQASDTFTVEVGPNQRSLILDAGGLSLSAAISGNIPIPASQLTFSVYADSDVSGNRVLIADNVTQGELLHLNAGVYNVECRFGSVNAIVRADIRVEPGQLTEATLYHRAAAVTLKLVSEPGGEAIADTDWSVTDADGNEIFATIGAFGNLVLAEGEYTVIARQGERVFNRDFEIRAGQPREVEVVTSFN